MPYPLTLPLARAVLTGRPRARLRLSIRRLGTAENAPKRQVAWAKATGVKQLR